MQLLLKQESRLWAANTTKKFLKITYRATSLSMNCIPRYRPPNPEVLLAVLAKASKVRVSLRIGTKRPTQEGGIQ